MFVRDIEIFLKGLKFCESTKNYFHSRSLAFLGERERVFYKLGKETKWDFCFETLEVFRSKKILEFFIGKNLLIFMLEF